MDPLRPANRRIASVDIFRALTMFGMIFVNDLWTLHDIPGWMGHTETHEDGMGLADVIFPAFLFIVGLSIPFAISNRRKKGEEKPKILWHIITRSFALLVMGFFMVNLENINPDLIPFSKQLWQILMALAIFFIWTDYRNGKVLGIIPEWIMMLLGSAILIFLASVYQSGLPEDPEWMMPHWWGILGIIGWTYLFSAVIYLLIGNNITGLLIFWLIFHILNAQEQIQLIEGLPQLELMTSGSHYAATMSGVLATVLYLKFRDRTNPWIFLSLLFGLAAVSIFYGFYTRPLWGIAKIGATPSWTTICAGISFATFGILYIIADVYNKTKWANIISPAGRSTLTCYLVPYYYYPLLALSGASLPEYLRGGYFGIVKSLLFALLIILITGILEKLKIRLKI